MTGLARTRPAARRAGATALLVAVAFAATSCASLPSPDDTSGSLLVFLVERDATLARAERPLADSLVLVLPDGTRLPVRLSQRAAVTAVRVPAGTLRVATRTLRYRGESLEVPVPDSTELVVPPSTVVLYPLVFLDSGIDSNRDGPTVRPITPANQRSAADTLRSDVSFTGWAGRGAEGFGPFSPFEDFLADRFEVMVVSDPPGAQVRIDGEYWGDAPVEVLLRRGKHYVVLSRTGYEPAPSYLVVTGPGTSETRLTPEPPGAAADSQRMRVLVSRFANLGEGADDYLAALFGDAISVALHDEGLDPVVHEPSAAGGPAELFGAAEEAGAQLLVTGDLLASGDRILIHAVLYDVRTEFVKAALLLAEPGGFSVFDSLDTVADEFATAVTRTLPEVGRAVIEERGVTADTLAYTERLTEAVIVRRRMEQEHAIALAATYGTVTDRLIVGASTEPQQRLDGPGLGLSVAYEYPLSLPLSLAVKASPFIVGNRDEEPVAFELPVYVGPRYSFYNLANDVYLSLLGSVHWAAPTTVRDRETDTRVPLPATLLATIVLDVGVKIYPGRSVDGPARFLDLGFTVGIGGVRTFLDAFSPSWFGPEVWLHAGFGRRL